MRKFFSIFQNLFFYKLVAIYIKDCKSILDVGCGPNSSIQSVIKDKYTEGIDIHKPSILKSRKNKIHTKEVAGNILDLNKYYKSKSFDAVIAIDVIEHFDKKDGVKLLKLMEQIARKRIILLTPNGFCHQDHYDDNPHQVHKSGWSAEDFRRSGYKVFGLRGYKSLRGEMASVKYKPWLLWAVIAFISESILIFFPKISYQLLAVKNISVYE